MGASRGGRSWRLGTAAAGLAVAVTVLILAVGSSQARSPIGTGQAKTTPKTVAQCKKQFKHNRKARVACEKRVKKKVTKPTTSCTLNTTWDGVGDGGDKQDYTVTVKEAGSGSGPYTAQVEVKILNPRVEICKATVSWYEMGKEAAGLQSSPVTIGVHGGVSSRVTLPAGATRAFSTVTGRLK
jgi:hypothetical protein